MASKRYAASNHAPVDGMEVISDDKYRGSIVADGNILFKGFSDSIEYTDETFPSDIDISSYRVFECLEGTLIRVFNRNDKWYTATSRRLDAFVSKWASPKTTFGQSFVAELRKLVEPNESDDKKFLSEFYDTYLIKGPLYTFLLLPSFEERIVCECKQQKVVYLCKEDPVSHLVDFDDDISINGVPFPKRKEIQGLKCAADVRDYVFDHTDYRTSQGVILFKQSETGDVSSIKVLSKEYADRYKIRGNTSSLKFRYLHLRKSPDELDLFFEVYPHMRHTAEEIEENIYKVCLRLHELYMKIHIENDSSVKCSKEEQSALQIIHNQYKHTRQRTTSSRINDILTAGNPIRLNKLLRESNMNYQARHYD